MTLIQELKNSQARDTLAHAMFNIVKKPTGTALLMLRTYLCALVCWQRAIQPRILLLQESRIMLIQNQHCLQVSRRSVSSCLRSVSAI